MHADSKIQSSTDKRAFHYRQSNFWRLLPASDYCRTRGNHIVVHSLHNETVLGSSRKLGGPAEHLIDGSENVFVGRPLKFRVHMLLKSAVMWL